MQEVGLQQIIFTLLMRNYVSKIKEKEFFFFLQHHGGAVYVNVLQWFQASQWKIWDFATPWKKKTAIENHPIIKSWKNFIAVF